MGVIGLNIENFIQNNDRESKVIDISFSCVKNFMFYCTENLKSIYFFLRWPICIMYTNRIRKAYKRIAKITHKMSQKFTRRLEYRRSITPQYSSLVFLTHHARCERVDCRHVTSAPPMSKNLQTCLLITRSEVSL